MQLDELVESLPEGLKREYFEKVRGVYEVAKGWVMVAVAVHLFKAGYGDVTFRKMVVLPSGSKVYVDVYCGELKAYVTCLTDTSFSWVKGRVSELKHADPRGAREATGKTTPKETYYTFHFIHAKREWPPKP